MKKKAAVIDMGTNTFHLLLVQLYDNQFEILYKERIPVKIGEGGISRDIILPEAQKRAICRPSRRECRQTLDRRPTHARAALAHRIESVAAQGGGCRRHRRRRREYVDSKRMDRNDTRGRQVSQDLSTRKEFGISYPMRLPSFWLPKLTPFCKHLSLGGIRDGYADGGRLRPDQRARLR
jgi:hypothetical protein